MIKVSTTVQNLKKHLPIIITDCDAILRTEEEFEAYIKPLLNAR